VVGQTSRLCSCAWSPEVRDGLDNDCDGIVDDLPGVCSLPDAAPPPDFGVVTALDFSTPPPTFDLATPAGSLDLAAQLSCGKPGDPGNALGVGKYCDTLADCSGNTLATLCATIGLPTAHFCTMQCDPNTVGACGDMANCLCQGVGRCGCIPTYC
jgi:hypothetical protein